MPSIDYYIGINGKYVWLLRVVDNEYWYGLNSNGNAFDDGKDWLDASKNTFVAYSPKLLEELYETIFD